jgi:hypothetical protein
VIITGNTPASFTGDEREKHLVDFVMSTVKRSEQETAPSRNQWKENDALFEGRQDWGPESEREDWRSRLFIHEYAPIIREAATAAQNQIFSRADFVNLIAGESVDPQFAEVLKKQILYYLSETGFSQKFYEWCLCGGIYGFATWKISVCNKLVWRPEVVVAMVEKENQKAVKNIKAANKDRFVLPGSAEELQGGLEKAAEMIFGKAATGVKRDIQAKKNLEPSVELYAVNPFDYFWEPDCNDINQSPWHCERFYKKWSELDPLFESGEVDKAKREAILKDSVSRPKSSFASTENYETQKLRLKNQLSSSSMYWSTVELFEYFGPILGRTGEVIDENRHVVIANGKYVIKDRPISYWNQRAPYRTAVFNRRPFKPNGAGIGDAAVNSQKLINELCSLFIDALRMDVYAPMAVNDDMLADKTQIDSGLKPGEIIHLYNGKASDAFSELPKAANNAPELFQTLEFLKLAGQKGSSINTMTSNPSSRARISAQEVRSNDGRRMETLNTLGFEIDVNGIEPLIEQIKLITIQFGFTSSNLKLLASKGILTEAEYGLIAGLSPYERFEEAMKSFKVEVRGFRAAIEREQYLARLGECTSQINQMPPFVHQQIDWKYLVKEFATAYGLKGDKILRQANETDRAQEENFFLKNDQFVGTTPQDDDPQHLIQHYQAVLDAGANQSLGQHIMMHIQAAMGKGLQVPPPPPDVAGALGLPMPGDPDQREEENAVKHLNGPEMGPLQ